jgi:molybdate transport system ATP-binding protein
MPKHNPLLVIYSIFMVSHSFTSVAHSPSPFLSFYQATIRRADKVVLSDITWTMQANENWAIVGANGAGKTSILEAILGKIPVVAGSIHYGFMEEWKASGRAGQGQSFSQFIEFLSPHFTFRKLSNDSSQYYQQRYNTADSEDFPTVREFLMETSAPVDEGMQQEKRRQIEAWTSRLSITNLLDRRVCKLSNGETKRVRLVKALLNRPALLLLDNPFTGLDSQARKTLRTSIQAIIEQGIQLVLVSEHNEIPEGITHVLQLQEGKIIRMADRKTFLQSAVAVLPDKKSDSLDALSHWQMPADLVYPFRTVIQLRNASVTYGGVQVLDHVSWTVATGEKWALLGPNGSGKSTLLSLVTGDNPQAYANDIYLFDRKRGSGESIWDIKKKIGFVSPELQAYYPRSISCFEVIISGFFDTLVATRSCSPEQAETATTFLALLHIKQLANTPFIRASTGEQRLVLLVRALVKNPPLLILDEPCQGLDDQNRERFKQAVDALCSNPNKSLIYVTHYADEIPTSVTKVLRLDQGKVVAQESL